MLWIVDLLLGLYWAFVLINNGSSIMEVVGIAVAFFAAGFCISAEIIKRYYE